MGDDISQIVENLPVHSLGNIQLFFQGGTFYTGGGLSPLAGTYYRPLMTVIFSAIYSVFGDNPTAFHAVQLLLYITVGFMLFLVLRKFFSQSLSLFLSLIYFIHPINSQMVYSIASMQDVQFLLFGLLALWILLRFEFVWRFVLVGLHLLLSLLSKEAGILWVGMVLLAVGLWYRKDWLLGVVATVVPVGLWLLLKVPAVGWSVQSHIAPIDQLGWERLWMMPELLVFYVLKFLLPLKLATGYYWTESSASFGSFIVPLMALLLLIGGLVYGYKRLQPRLSTADQKAWLFFGCWTVVGMASYVQIVPLDMTASETWLAFAGMGILGLLGMLGRELLAIRPVNIEYMLMAGVLVILLLAGRTMVRGFDYADPYALAATNISVDDTNYNAYNQLAEQALKQNDFASGQEYAAKSVAIYPTFTNYNHLGLAYGGLREYAKAAEAYRQGLRHNPNYNVLYQNLAQLALAYQDEQLNEQFMQQTVKKFPGDGMLWLYLAIYEQKNGNHQEALDALQHATAPQVIYDAIMSDQKLKIDLYSLSTSIAL